MTVSAGEDPAVRFSGVTKRFRGHVALEGLSFRAERGELCGVIGPNGAGKTTALRLLVGILVAEEGRIEVLGEAEPRRVRDRIAYLPEERGLYQKMSPRRFLSFYGRLKGLRGRALKTRVDEGLGRMGLSEWADRRIEALSKGMQQKVQFLAAVISRPDLLVLDEPFSGLDPLNQEALREAVLELRRQGVSVLLSTHDMALAERLCDRVLMIHRGRKVLDGEIAAILDAYGERKVRLRLEGGARMLEGIEGIAEVRDAGNVQEVSVRGDPQDLLRALIERARVDLFEVARPTLHEVFLRIAGNGDSDAGKRVDGAATGGGRTEEKRK